MSRLTVICLPVLLALAMAGCSSESIVTVIVTPAPEQNPTPIIHTVVVTATPGLAAAPIIQTVVVTATPGPVAPPIIQTVVVTATPPPTSTPRPTLEAMAGMMAG